MTVVLVGVLVSPIHAKITCLTLRSFKQNGYLKCSMIASSSAPGSVIARSLLTHLSLHRIVTFSVNDSQETSYTTQSCQRDRPVRKQS